MSLNLPKAYLRTTLRSYAAVSSRVLSPIGTCTYAVQTSCTFSNSWLALQTVRMIFISTSWSSVAM